jgi:hypothetical protein
MQFYGLSVFFLVYIRYRILIRITKQYLEKDVLLEYVFRITLAKCFEFFKYVYVRVPHISCWIVFLSWNCFYGTTHGCFVSGNNIQYSSSIRLYGGEKIHIYVCVGYMFIFIIWPTTTMTSTAVERKIEKSMQMVVWIMTCLA